MYLKQWILSSTLVQTIITISSFRSENHEVIITEGRNQYNAISADARMPRFGDCWKTALAELEHGCGNLDEDVQSRMALGFANCFLQKAGLRTYPCQKNRPVSDCLKNVDNNAFTSYANFFTHTHNMCYFLQSQIWQEETDKTVNRLTVNSEKVGRSLEQSHSLQNEILSNQHLTIEYHRQLVENGTLLSHAIETSRENVVDMMAEFKTSTAEQRSMIFEVFDRVSRLQNLVVSEVNWLYTVVFYGAALLVIYIVTATKRTGDARLWLFAVLSLNLILERAVTSYTLPNNHTKVVTDITETLYERIWMLRQTSIGLSVMLLTVFIIKFKDYNVINNSLLQEIKKQNLELKRSMETFQVGNRYSTGRSVDVLDAAGRLPSLSLSAMLSEDTGFQGDEEEFTDEESFSSTMSDKTFDWSDEEFDTAQNSREHSGNVTPTNKSVLEGFSGQLQTSTTLHPSILDCTAAQTVSPLLGSTQQERVRRPRISYTPVREYNLRSRNSSYSSPGNPLLTGESEEQFSQHVRQQAAKTKRNAAKWQMALQKEKEDKDFSDSD